MKARDATGNFIRYLYQRSVVFLFRVVSVTLFDEIKQKFYETHTFCPSMFK